VHIGWFGIGHRRIGHFVEVFGLDDGGYHGVVLRIGPAPMSLEVVSVATSVFCWSGRASGRMRGGNG